jgi:hypothetical protein
MTYVIIYIELRKGDIKMKKIDLKRLSVFEDGLSKEERALRKIDKYVRENLDTYLKMKLVSEIKDFTNVMFIYKVTVRGLHSSGKLFDIDYEYDALNDRFKITDIKEIIE